jgi:hypothetical protein
MISTRDAEGTGAVPILPTVAMMMSMMNDAAVTCSPFKIANQMQAVTDDTQSAK